MKIAYKKRHLNINLFFGLVWFVWFVVNVFGKEEPGWHDYGWIIISMLYLELYFYQSNYKYLTIKNGSIKVNGPFGKNLLLAEVKQIKKFAGDFILKTDHQELTINTQIIDPSSLAELVKELDKLNLALE